MILFWVFTAMALKSLNELRQACLDLPAGSDAAADAVARRQDTLTKPRGSLGKLEQIAAWLGRWQGREMPRLDEVKVIVFAGNHGVTAQGVSAYPSEVTVQMVANFAGGGAAINQLARLAGAELAVIPLELDRPRVTSPRRRPWTKPISSPPSRPAMTR